MTNGQDIFLLIIALIWIGLMIWLYANGLYIEILKSVIIFIGCFISSMIFAMLGGSNE